MVEVLEDMRKLPKNAKPLGNPFFIHKDHTLMLDREYRAKAAIEKSQELKLNADILVLGEWYEDPHEVYYPRYQAVQAYRI